MSTFIRAVVTGFGFSLGAALFKQVQKRLGFHEESKEEVPPDASEQASEEGEGGSEPGPA